MLGRTPRTPLGFALLASALLVGAAAAQETDADATLTTGPAGAEAHADADAMPEPTFRVKATPEKLALKSGGREAIKILAESKTDQGLKLALSEEPKGLALKLSADALRAGPGVDRAVVEAVVAAREDAPRGEHVLRFVATSESGETHEARVIVHVLGPAAEKPTERSSERPAAKPEPARPGFGLRLDPEAQRTKGGERLTYTLVAHAPRNATVALSLAHVPRGYEADLGAETLTLVAGERALAKLTVFVPEGAESGTLVVHGKLAEGNAVVAAKAHVKVVKERPVTKPTPAVRDGNASDAEAPDERYPMAREARPAASGPGFRMHLYPRDALVGPEGGRALVLFQGGDEDQLLKLSSRVREEAGWRVHVREHVRLPAHGQAWAWVYLQPGPDSGPIHYGLVAAGPQGRAVAEGTAQVEAPQTA